MAEPRLPDDPGIPSVGQTVSHYRLLEFLGVGGMGVVYAAEDLRLGRKVALKFLPADLSADTRAIERFRREAQAASALNHPNICTVHDIGEIPGGEGRAPHHFIVMEMLDGHTLERRIDGTPLPIDTTIDFGMQIARALDAAHAKGIIHRDIKPANIFVTSAGQIKVLDFGLAKIAPRPTTGTKTPPVPLTTPGAVIGTAAYMSPEQVRGEHLDTRSDLFSFGALLYEMATAQQPFVGDTVPVLFDAILNKTPAAPMTLNPRMPPDLERIIVKALEKSRETRYQTAADLEADLKRLKRQTDSPPQAKQKWLVWAALICAVLAVSLVVWLRLAQRPAQIVAIGAAGRPAIAVLTFDVPAGAEDTRWLSRALQVMVLTSLAQMPGLDVISSQRVDEIVKGIGGHPVPPGRVLEVARQTGAGAVVVGSAFTIGREIRIDAQVQDVATGRLLGAHSVRGTDVFQAVDDLSPRIRQSLNLEVVEKSRAIADVTSGSVEALRLYFEGLEARRNLREADARRALERAVEIDSRFASAYLQLADTCERLGDAAAAERARREGRRYADRLPERWRLFWQADDARRQGHAQEAIALLETLVARYPDEEQAYEQLAIILAREFGDARRALVAAERGVKALPQSGVLRNEYGYRLLAVGRYTEAIREFEIYGRLRPREPNPHDSLAEAYLISGDPQRALEHYERALAIDPSFVHAYAGRAWAHGMMGEFDQMFVELTKLAAGAAAHRFPPSEMEFLRAFAASRTGQYTRAAEHLAAGLRHVERLRDRDNATWFHLLSGALAIERGRLDEARQSTIRAEAALSDIADASRRRVREVFTLSLDGVVKARSAQLDAARAQLATLDKVREPASAREAWAFRLLEGEIALASGQSVDAERAFLAGEPQVKMWFSLGDMYPTILTHGISLRDGVARAKQARGDAAGALHDYGQLLPPDVNGKWTAMLEPRYVLQRARLLDRTGDAAGARREYARFLDVWRGADPNLPEVAEATRALRPTAQRAGPH